MTIGNLSKLYDQATEHDRLEGMLAYRRYHRVLRWFADYYGFGIVPTVEVFAATSPNNDYHGNLRSTASVLDAVRKGIPPGAYDGYVLQRLRVTGIRLRDRGGQFP